MNCYRWQQIVVSLIGFCCCVMALPQSARGERLDNVLSCGAFVDDRYRDNQQNAIEKLELTLFDVPRMMPNTGGSAGFTCAVSPKNFGDAKEFSEFAEKLDSTLSKCVQDVFAAAPKKTWGRGVVQVKLTRNGQLTYIEHFGEPSSRHINKAITCAKRKLGTEHSLQVSSDKDVYVLHRWSYVPRRSIWQANSKATTGAKKLRPQFGGSKASPKGTSLREATIQTRLNRVLVSLQVSYSQATTARAERLVESELRKAAGCVAREFYQRRKAGAVEFKVMFTADADGLAITPTLVSMHPKDEELYSCVGAGVKKLDIAKGTFEEPVTVTADVRVQFE